MQESARRRIDRRLPIYAAAGTFMLTLPALFYEPDISLILYTVLAASISLLLLIWRFGRNGCVCRYFRC